MTDSDGTISSSDDLLEQLIKFEGFVFRKIEISYGTIIICFFENVREELKGSIILENCMWNIETNGYSVDVEEIEDGILDINSIVSKVYICKDAKLNAPVSCMIFDGGYLCAVLEPYVPSLDRLDVMLIENPEGKVFGFSPSTKE